MHSDAYRFGLMDESSAVYGELDRRWKAACRMLLNAEVGDLKEFEGWLSSMGKKITYHESESGEIVAFALPLYPKAAKIIPYAKTDFNKGFEPLSINEVKDIDSIVEAVSERVGYAGNVVLGVSQHVSGSTDVADSFYVKDSAQIWNSKYVSCGAVLEHGDTLFGCTHNGNMKFCIGAHNADYLVRCFMSESCYESSDCYYSFGLSGAKSCMFCFNLHGATHRIGNLALPPEKYAEIKAKLVSEIAGELKRKGKLPSVFELAGRAKPASAPQIPRNVEITDFGSDMDEVEKEFGVAMGTIVGKAPEKMQKYAQWLGKYSGIGARAVKSAADGEKLGIAGYCHNFDFPKDRVVRREHALAIGRANAMDAKALGKISFAAMPELVSNIAYFSQEYFAGKNLNLSGTQITYSAVNSKDSTIVINSKNCAYDYYVESSKSVFGCNALRKSSYALKCCLSSMLTRCLEVDSSKNCSDGYFMHNCENVHDSMFCFNTKNKRNAIGNAELPKEKYLWIKEMVKGELSAELAAKGTLGLSVFSLAD
jgi:hypothetical protein